MQVRVVLSSANIRLASMETRATNKAMIQRTRFVGQCARVIDLALQDEVTFQNDIDSITDWAKTWQMSLNFDKCNIMSITRSNSESTISYQMSSVPLGIVSCHKYLGIFIQDDLQWDTQVREVKSKASKILGLLQKSI